MIATCDIAKVSAKVARKCRFELSQNTVRKCENAYSVFALFCAAKVRDSRTFAKSHFRMTENTTWNTVMTFEPKIHPTHLRRRLDYDPDAGFFTWKAYDKACGDWNELNTGKRAEIVSEAGYLVIPIGGRLVKAHHAAVAYMTGEWPGGIVDHQDRMKSNNTWENLRPATAKQNAANRSMRKDNTTGHKGVYSERGRWRAIITVDGKAKHLGYFAEKADAAEAYMRAAKEHFGEFATDGV